MLMMAHVDSILADSDYKIRQAEKSHLWLKEQQMLQHSIFRQTIISSPTSERIRGHGTHFLQVHFLCSL